MCYMTKGVIKVDTRKGLRLLLDLFLIELWTLAAIPPDHKRLGLVTQEPYASIKLTEKGRRVARHVLDRHTLIRSFLVKLGVAEKTADRDACLMEHILSAETLDKIKTFTERQ